jgi:hypothetical protein
MGDGTIEPSELVAHVQDLVPISSIAVRNTMSAFWS